MVVKPEPWIREEVKQGRMSIKDNWKERSFTVTMEKLRLDDSDVYWCGIESWADLGINVDVTIERAQVRLCVCVDMSLQGLLCPGVNCPSEGMSQGVGES